MECVIDRHVAIPALFAPVDASGEEAPGRCRQVPSAVRLQGSLVVVTSGSPHLLSSVCWLRPAPFSTPAMQAYPQAFGQSNKGTLVPGQSITVNKYTVVVERYLSQGLSLLHRPAISTRPPSRRLRPCLSREDCTAGLQHYPSCSQAYRRPKRSYAFGGQEGGRHHGEYLCTAPATRMNTRHPAHPQRPPQHCLPP